VAHLLIWGDTREILAGGTPPGTPAEEVRSLGALQSLLDGRFAGAMVLADAHCLEAEREKTEAWLRNGGSAQAFLVAVTDVGEADDVLNRLPFLDDVLVRPVTPVRLLRRLERGLDVIRNRRVIRQLNEKLTQRGEELSKLNDIGVRLSAERDIDKLLELILQNSREITGADAGSLYLIERADENGEAPAARLRFELTQNDTVKIPFHKSTMPLDKASSISGYVAVTGEEQNVPDVYRLPGDSPFQVSRSFDEKSGYRSKSMLVVPMRDHKGIVIGVIQLINKKRDRSTVLTPASLVEEEVITFTSEDEKLAKSLASQAAVAFENADLIRRIRTLFDQFIHHAVAAVELRDPTTAGHSERVAVLTVGLAEKVNAAAAGLFKDQRFTRDEVEQLRYAALLHDFGKVGVQEKYLRKGKKLFATQKITIRQRFAYILESIEADYLRGRLEALQSGRGADEVAAIERAYARRRADAERVLQAVLAANEPTVVEEESFNALMDIPARRFGSFDEEDRFPVEAWADGPFLSTEEIEVLSIRKGSLSDYERQQIYSHVSHTYDFLRNLPWTSELRRIPEIAWAHHEKLDGSGYPRGIRAPDILIESRMMTIADIYDALVAWDRPYKHPVSEEKAREILVEEVDAGKIDGDLLGVFLDAKVYELPEFRNRLRRRT
jgi:HD-GYP domain-containing protein (c-di-GMP phosphodiesterase class II)